MRDDQVHETIKMQSEMIHTNNITDNIFLRLKEQSFKKIFNILDSDEDGVISSFNLDTKSLQPQIFQIVKPIIEELKSEEESLNYNEFSCAMEKLFNVNHKIKK